MKQLLLTLTFIFIVISGTMHSQTAKGTFLLGGDASMNYSSNDNGDSFYFGLSPDLGYFVADNIAIGGNLPISYFSTDNYKLSNLGISPFFRYYFANSGKSSFFIPAQFGLGLALVEANNDKNWRGTRFFEFGVGWAYFLNQNIGLETQLVYNNFKLEDSDAVNKFEIKFGFQIYFNR